jgi:uncharacterized protein involved in exopolysaccharide biosynthesis
MFLTLIQEQKLQVNETVDLGVLWSMVWGGRWHVIFFTAVFSIGAVFYALSKPDIFTSEVLLVPVSDGGNASVGGLAAQFGGLANIAGISLGGSSADKSTVGIAILKSRSFVDFFIKKYNLAVPLSSVESWSFKSNEWVIDSEKYDKKNGKWKAEWWGGGDGPTSWALYKIFSNEVLNVFEDKKTGLIRVSVSLMSPVDAQRWVTNIVRELNITLRERDISEARNSIEYLKLQLQKTNVAEMQQVFYQLIEQQLKTVMLAEVSAEYAFKTLDQAFMPEEKSGPRRSLICIIGFVLGGVVGIIVALFRGRR